jgi:hypothetical protein
LAIEDISSVDIQLGITGEVQTFQQKISKIAYEFRKFTFRELQKVFLQVPN